jgi:hypothetical protein
MFTEENLRRTYGGRVPLLRQERISEDGGLADAVGSGRDARHLA